MLVLIGKHQQLDEQVVRACVYVCAEYIFN
jgi:hypothetical protein